MVKSKKTDKKKSSPSKKVSNNMNINLNNRNYNLIKVKSSYLTLIGTGIFIMALLILMAIYILYYLNKLRTCRCFQEKNNENNSNIDYLIIIEFLTIATNIILLMNLVSLYLSVDSLKSGGYNARTKITLYIGLLVYLIVFGFFVYNIYKLSQNVDSDCLCTQDPIRYFLYLQGIMTFINMILVINSLFLI